MADLSGIGRMLIALGAGILLIGVVLTVLPKVPGLGWLGKLPGDILIQRDNFTFYFPLATSLLISLLLSLLWYFFSRR